jgi:hypothetical protein
MATLNVDIIIDDNELSNAIQFLGALPERVDQIKEEYLSGKICIDFSKIKNDQKRYYHTNGVTALLITIQEELNATS